MKIGNTNRKPPTIVLTAVLVLLVFAVFVMPVNAVDITVTNTTTGSDLDVKGGVSETFNITVLNGGSAAEYITEVNISYNISGFTFDSGTDWCNITTDFSNDTTNLSWTFSPEVFNPTDIVAFGFNATAKTHTINTTYTWTVYATDNTTAISPKSFNVLVIENTAPVVSLVTINDSIVQGGAPIHIIVNVTDANGTASVDVNGTALEMTSGTATDGGWEGDYTVPSVAGTYALGVNATDNAGNTGTN